MGQSLTVACNFYNECHALPGLLECAAQFADEILMYESGPGGEHSSDGSLEIIEKFGGVDLRFGSIDEGYGVVRTQLLRECKTDWCMILDADERFYRYAPRLTCAGSQLYPQEHYPQLVDMDLQVQVWGVYDQLAALRELMRPEFDAIVTSRRHWQSWGLTRPSQNWRIVEDWQARILRKCDHVQYRKDVRMHEQLIDTRTGEFPRANPHSIESCQCYHDHYHLAVKRMEIDQREHDKVIYDAIHEGRRPPSEEEFRARKASA